MQKLVIRSFIFVLFAGVVLAWRVASSGTPNTLKVQRPLMGTIWTIEASSSWNAGPIQAAIDDAYRELERIDQMMSEWNPASPISRVNANAGLLPVAVPAELRDLIVRSQKYSYESERTFDITWRGMGRIWRFDEHFRVPSSKEVEEARRLIDCERISIRGNEIFLPESGMSIGLGGIAKGYAVDRAMQILVDHGIRDALVNGGGDVRVMGKPRLLGVQHPRKEHGELLGKLVVQDQALVTSGDYERFRMADGVRYHHIIDPRTGWPATASSAVTVLAPNAEIGVVMAKAIFILGPEKGLLLAHEQGLEALLIDPQGHEFKTAGFPALY